MDSTFNKLVESLSFQVMAGPCNHQVFDDTTKKSVGTPLNVKVKFRHKDDVHRGVISVPKFENVRMSQNLRLINSDETIMSFDFLMDTKTFEKPEKKSQKKVFQILRPGICLGSKNKNDDDGYPYVRPIIEKVNPTFSANEVNILKRKNNLKKNTIRQPFDDSNRAPTMFLGKCKPGGCLDPPFGEERYAYEPILNKNVSVKYQIKGAVEHSEVSRCQSYNTQIHSNQITTLKEKEKNKECKLYDDLLITYPSSLNCKEVSNINELTINTDKSSISKTETHIQSFYKPPRSKETSISSTMEVIDIKNIDNAIRIKPNYTVATNLKSPSKDSIYTQTGCPAEAVLPITLNLSPIKSNLTSLQSNLVCEIEETKKCLGEQNITKFENKAEVKQQIQGVFENSSENPNVLRIEKNSISGDIQSFSDDIKISPERVPNNKTKNFNEAQINTKQEEEQSIIVIAPARDLEETWTSDVDGEYLTNFNDKNQIDRSSMEFRETQYVNQKLDVLDTFESQVYQTDLEKQSSSIHEEHFDYESNNGSNDQKVHIFDYSFIGQKSEINTDYTSPKSSHTNPSHIKNIFLGPTHASSSSTKNSISNLEDVNIAKDFNVSEKSSNHTMCLKLSKTDGIQKSNLIENIILKKEAEKSSIMREDVKESITSSLKSIQKAVKPNQESIENISLPSRNTLEQVILENKPGERVDSTIQASEILNFSPNLELDPSHLTQQALKKSIRDDSPNNDNISLKSTIQDNLIKKEDTTERSEILKNSNSSSKSSKEETTIHRRSISLSEKSISETMNEKKLSNIESYKIVSDMKSSRKSDITIDRIQSNNNFLLSTQIISKTFQNSIMNDSLTQLDTYEIGKDRLSAEISLEIMESPNRIKTELGQVVQIRISQHDTQSDKKVDNVETFIKHELSNIILKGYTDTENNLLETSKLNVKSNININLEQSNLKNYETKTEIKKDEGNLIAIKEELKHLTGNNGSKDELKLYDNNSNKEVTKSDVFQLDFALQSYVNNKKERAFKTIDSADASEKKEQESILLFKSKLRVNKDEIRLPIDPETDLVILVKRNNNNNLIKTRDDKNEHSEDALDLDIATENINAGLLNELQEMSKIYEQTLIPVQNMLKALKEEVNSLVHNQILIREKLTNKSKPTRLINVNRRCACYR